MSLLVQFYPRDSFKPNNLAGSVYPYHLMDNLTSLRLRKLATALVHPVCWRPLACGVAPTVDHLPVLQNLDVDLILDVGANRGQFSLASRIAKPGVPIVAFEPIPGEAAIFRNVHGGCSDVRLHEAALGAEDGGATLHVSRRADSSSLLPIGRAQREIFAGTEEAGTLTVPVRRLDGYLSELGAFSKGLLKLDVQGFELKVLEGATETLACCAYVYAECSARELYEGQALYGEVAEFLAAHGFRQISRHNEMLVDGELVQADFLFGR